MISFRELSRGLPATVGIAIALPDGRTEVFGAWSTGVAWSTIKVPLAVAAARAGVDVSASVITDSDNDVAEVLWSRLGGEAARRVQDVIREAGDLATVVESRRLRAEYTPFGQTQWSLADQALFAAGLSRITGASPVIELMGNLCIDHRWGLAAKGYAAKGGWGPGLAGDYLVRQFAILPGDIGVALAADAPEGGHDAGVAAVDGLADWVVDRLAEQ